MFKVDVAKKRVIIAHTVQASDGPVELTTTLDLCDVPEEKMLLWAASSRLIQWIASLEIKQLTRAEVKKRFDNLVVECKEHIQSKDLAITMEEEIMIENLRRLVGKGASMEQVVQSLIRSTRKLG